MIKLTKNYYVSIYALCSIFAIVFVFNLFSPIQALADTVNISYGSVHNQFAPEPAGFKFSPASDLYINNITRYTGNTGDYGRILNSSYQVIDSCTFSGDTCTFATRPILVSGLSYYIVSGNKVPFNFYTSTLLYILPNSFPYTAGSLNIDYGTRFDNVFTEDDYTQGFTAVGVASYNIDTVNTTIYTAPIIAPKIDFLGNLDIDGVANSASVYSETSDGIQGILVSFMSYLLFFVGISLASYLLFRISNIMNRK